MRLVLSSKAKPGLDAAADKLRERLRIEIVPFDAAMAELAHDAFRRCGRHPARLNFGDCMAYALAKSTGEPLLFKGQDLPQTDISPALP